MAKYKVLQPISIGGGRVEKGEVVDIDKDAAEAYGKDFVTPASKSETADETAAKKAAEAEAKKAEAEAKKAEAEAKKAAAKAAKDAAAKGGK